MEMQCVDSSNIESIGYDLDLNILRIEFKSGGTYEYHNVPEGVFHELRLAPSVGTFHSQNIKNFYSYTKI